MSAATTTYRPGDQVVISENDAGIRAGSSGEVVRLLDNGSLVVEVLPGKRYAVAPADVSLKRDAVLGIVTEQATTKPPARRSWHMGDRVRVTRDLDGGPVAGTPGSVFGSSVIPGYVQVKSMEHGVFAVRAEDLEPDIPPPGQHRGEREAAARAAGPQPAPESRLRQALKERRAREREAAAAIEPAEDGAGEPTASADPDPETPAPVVSLASAVSSEQASIVESLAEAPRLLDEPADEVPKQRKSRGPMSPEHKRKLMEGRERALAEKRAAKEQLESEQATETPVEVEGVVAIAKPPDDPLVVDETAAVPAAMAHDAPPPATADPAALLEQPYALPAVPCEPPIGITFVSTEPAVSTWEATPLAFNLTDRARTLLMEALAARVPIVRVGPLISWLHDLEAEGEA